MSILIRGMEMPKNCWECHFGHGDSGACVVDFKQHGDWDEPQNCPLVPVPPHRKLIDADALMSVIAKNMKEAKQADNYDWWNACSVAGDFLMDATTIIPEEECE